VPCYFFINWACKNTYNFELKKEEEIINLFCSGVISDHYNRSVSKLRYRRGKLIVWFDDDSKQVFTKIIQLNYFKQVER